MLTIIGSHEHPWACRVEEKKVFLEHKESESYKGTQAPPKLANLIQKSRNTSPLLPPSSPAPFSYKITLSGQITTDFFLSEKIYERRWRRGRRKGRGMGKEGRKEGTKKQRYKDRNSKEMEKLNCCYY